jgi:hypothetical protein
LICAEGYPPKISEAINKNNNADPKRTYGLPASHNNKDIKYTEQMQCLQSIDAFRLAEEQTYTVKTLKSSTPALCWRLPGL